MRNLALDPQSTSEISILREQLHAELRQQSDPRMEGRGTLFDEYLHAQPDHVGFYERFMAGEKLQPGWVNQSDFEPAPVKQ
jgi:hypothetical protein